MIQFDSLDKGFCGTYQGCTVVYTQQDFDNLWDMNYAPMQRPKPTVDFSKEMVLAAYTGPSGLWSNSGIEIYQVNDVGSALEALFRPSADSSPVPFVDRINAYHLVKVPCSDAEVTFLFESMRIKPWQSRR